MDIPALSMAIAQTKLQSEVGTALMKQSLEMAEVQSAEMIKMMELSVNPNVGAHFDVSV